MRHRARPDLIQVGGAHGQAPIELPKEGDDFRFDDILPANLKPMIDTEAGPATARYLQALMPFSPPRILNMAWDERVRVCPRRLRDDLHLVRTLGDLRARRGLGRARPRRLRAPSLRRPAAQVTLCGWYLGIPSNLPEESVALAWNIIEWLASAEMMMKEYSKHGNRVAPRHSVSQDPRDGRALPGDAACR